MTIDWTDELLGQVELHWERQLGPRLRGLSDDEYFWEPVAGCWGLRWRAAPGSGEQRLLGDFEVPPPDPAPVTTIGWRLRHLVGVTSGMRAMSVFGGPPVDVFGFGSPPTAAEAVQQLERSLHEWSDAVRAVEDLTAPAGPEGSGLEDWTVAGIVLHVHREIIHHGSEIALLRDLYGRSA